ncbi:hypothetical protein BH09MYX1_BH09MYX1_59960 [soil metagenome]
MKKSLLLLAAACAFGLAPFAKPMGQVPGAAWLVLLGVGLGLGTSGYVSALAIAFGATAALTGTILGSISPAIGGAVLLALAYGERTLRVRTAQGKLLHVGAAFGAGALAGTVASAYSAAAVPVHAVAIVVAAVLVALPQLIDADDPLAHSLEGASRLVSDPVKGSLRDGAELRRQSHDIPIDDEAQKLVQKTWTALGKLADVRVRLERTKQSDAGKTAGAIAEMIDVKIRDHVTALGRAYTAADTKRAATVGLDDLALKNVETASESMEEVSRALADVDGERSAKS